MSTSAPFAMAGNAAATDPHGPTIMHDAHRSALFLDFDGTLADIAQQPELVAVPHDLIDLLARLSGQLDGALAIVSGRALGDIDRFLSPLILPVAAEHGAVERLAGHSTRQLACPNLGDVERVALALALQHEGLRVEIKSAAVALHYRHAPQLEAVCLQAMAEAVKRTPGVDLLQGKFVFEIKPAGVSKGTAIRSFMGSSPFIGRVPLFAGDDTTDEAGFAVVQAMGGEGIKVGEGRSVARHRCSSPAVLRQWLRTNLEKAA